MSIKHSHPKPYTPRTDIKAKQLIPTPAGNGLEDAAVRMARSLKGAHQKNLGADKGYAQSINARNPHHQRAEGRGGDGMKAAEKGPKAPRTSLWTRH